MLKKNSQITQKITVFSKNNESRNVTTSITLNQNPDAWLINYATTILDLIAQKEATQFIDDLMGNDEAHNHCIADAAHSKNQELNQTINSNCLFKAGYKEQLEIAEQCSWVL